MALTLAQARAVVQTNVQASIDPVLTDAEIDAILTATAGAGGVWVTGTAYTYGARVLPTVRNGHVYAVTTAGTSGATEPAWPTSARSSVTDGTTLIWQEAGTDSAELYNLRAATFDAWTLKMAKAADYVNLSAGGQSLSLQQVLTNLELNRRRWAPVGVV